MLAGAGGGLADGHRLYDLLRFPPTEVIETHATHAHVTRHTHAGVPRYSLASLIDHRTFPSTLTQAINTIRKTLNTFF